MEIFMEKLSIGFAKSIIPIVSIVGMIQYHETNIPFAYLWAFIFIIGYMINEALFANEVEGDAE